MRHGGRRREVGSGEARPRTFAIVHGPEWRDVSSRRSGRGPTTQGSPGTFRAALQLPGGGGGKEVRGGRCRGAGVLRRVGVGGAEVLGAGGCFSRQPGLLAGRDWRAAAAPLAPSPSSRWPETRSLPTKNSWARPVLLELFKCGAAAALPAAAAEVSQERGYREAWVLTGRD